MTTAPTTLQEAYEQAKDVAARRKHLSAARLFLALQKLAIQSGQDKRSGLARKCHHDCLRAAGMAVDHSPLQWERSEAGKLRAESRDIFNGDRVVRHG